MQRSFLTYLFLFTTLLAIHAQRSDNYRGLLRDKTVSIGQTNLPIVFITVSGKTIQRDSYVAGRMKIIHNGDGQTNYGDTMTHRGQHIDYEGWIALKYRGNTSFSSSDKKPLALRTLASNILPANGGEKQKVKLLGMAKDNKWAMIAPWCDETMVRDVLSFELGRPWMDWVPSGRLCEVILDGTYYGVYVLTERVSKGKHRLNLHDPGEDDGDLTGDWHVSVDHGFDPYFTSTYRPWQTMDGRTKSNYSIKYEYGNPDYEDFASLPTGARQALINEVKKMEDSFMASNWQDPQNGYRSHIDVESFIDYMLATEVSMNIDGYRLSTHLYKHSRTREEQEGLDSRWKATLWDYNIAWGNANYYDGDRSDRWQYRFNTAFTWDDAPIPFYWHRMLQDTAYVSQLQQRWAEYRKGNHSTSRLLATVDSLASLLTVSGAAERNEKAWGIYTRTDIWPLPYYASSYDDAVDHMKSWIRKRLAFLDSQLLPPRDIETEPIEIASGWNADIVAEATPASTKTSRAIDGADRAFYSQALRSDGGLPTRRLITSANEGRRYRLAPYDGQNALVLQGRGNKGTLRLATPVETSELFILATSGNGSSALTVTLSYTDGTEESVGTMDVRDWSVRENQLQGDEAVSRLGNIYRSSGTMSDDNHYCLFDFSVPVDATRTLQAITFQSQSDAIASVLACSMLKAEPSAVEPLVMEPTDSERRPVGIYSVDGRRLPESHRGICIIRYSDGTAKKVVR